MTPTEAQSAPAIRRAPQIERHLVIVHRPGWQSIDDWREVAQKVRRADPSIAVFVVNADEPDGPLVAAAAKLPTLVFSAAPIGRFTPGRGKVYQGQLIPKALQLKRIHEAGLPVPPSAVLSPNFVPDRSILGPLVVLKPTDLASSSHGKAIQLMRTERVRYVPPEELPEDHPGRRGPIIVQKYIDTGPHVQSYRVLTLFGDPLLCQLSDLEDERVDLDADDATLESANIAIQGGGDSRHRRFIYHADVVHLARRVHAAIPEVPLKGIDIVREASTGRLYVLEINPGGNTWHFSSNFLAAARAKEPPETTERRLKQLDAFGTAALALVRVTRAEAE